MPQRLVLALTAALLFVVSACGSGASSPSAPAATQTPAATPTAAPTSTPAPSPSASAAAIASGDPFADQPYTIELPAGWQAFDVSSLDKTALDAYTKANPGFAGAMQTFSSLPNARMAINPLLGNAAILIALPSQGMSLDVIGKSFDAQFQAVPNVTNKPTSKPVTLPAGSALHWPISLSVNNTSGQKTKLEESIYLLVDDKTALMTVFVGPGDGGVQDEQKIMESIAFKS
jgi:hypothetical protein